MVTVTHQHVRETVQSKGMRRTNRILHRQQKRTLDNTVRLKNIGWGRRDSTKNGLLICHVTNKQTNKWLRDAGSAFGRSKLN